MLVQDWSWSHGQDGQRIIGGIGTPPLIRWREGTMRAPTLPTNPKRSVIDFLPVVRRCLRRQGLVIDAITYDSPARGLLDRRRTNDPLLIRRDPRDLD